MTKQNPVHKLTRPLVITMMAAVAIPALMVAPSAYAGDKASPYKNGNTYQADRARDKQKANRKTKPNSQRERDWREDRRRGNGDWSNDRERQRRYDRAVRDQRNNRERRSDRTNRRDDRRSDRTNRRDDRRYERNNRRNDRSNRRDWQRRNDRYWRRQSRRSNNYRPYRNTRWNNYYNGYQTSYRSSLGISFIFGQPGYSRYRWAPSRYSYYQPGYMSYANYQSTTRCERIVIDGFHQGHVEQVSVLQCSNPYDGSYIVQGTEQVINCTYNQPYYRR